MGDYMAEGSADQTIAGLALLGGNHRVSDSPILDLAWRPLRAIDVLTGTVNTMQLETKFLRLRTPVTLGSRFDEWEVTWVGGWTRHQLSYLVMVARIKPPARPVRPSGNEKPPHSPKPTDSRD
jgi:hypothetical protein